VKDPFLRVGGDEAGCLLQSAAVLLLTLIYPSDYTSASVLEEGLISLNTLQDRHVASYAMEEAAGRSLDLAREGGDLGGHVEHAPLQPAASERLSGISEVEQLADQGSVKDSILNAGRIHLCRGRARHKDVLRLQVKRCDPMLVKVTQTRHDLT